MPETMTATQRKRVLFVDDEPPVLSLLQSLLRHASVDCDAAFTDRGAKALQLMAEQPFDAVVSDMRMPEMTGADLLEKVRDQYPRAARVILSGYADQQMSVRSLLSVHQFLSKPFTMATLQSVLGRLLSLDVLVSDPAWQTVLGGIHQLPSPAAFQQRIERELALATLPSESLGGIAAQDIALTAKLLQVVNSSFFGAARPIVLAKESAQSLGVGLLRTLAGTRLLASSAAEDAPGGLCLADLCQHGVTTGLYATRILASERTLPDTIKAAFTAGVLHDAGKLVMATRFPEKYAQVQSLTAATGLPSWQAERQIFGVEHGPIGAYLLAVWGLPQSLVDAVAYHHAPSAAGRSEMGIVTAVHVADLLQKQPPGGTLTLSTPGLDGDHLRAARVDDQRLGRWVQACTGA